MSQKEGIEELCFFSLQKCHGHREACMTHFCAFASFHAWTAELAACKYYSKAESIGAVLRIDLPGRT